MLKEQTFPSTPTTALGTVIPPTGNSVGLVRVISGAEMLRQEQAQMRAIAEADKQASTRVLTSLASHVMKCWEAARDHKKLRVEKRMLAALRAKQGEYDPEKLKQIKEFGGSETYLRAASNRMRTAYAWLRDVYNQPNEKAWGFELTPSPTLPPDVEQKIASKMQEIEMQLQQQGIPYDAQALHEIQDELEHEAERGMREGLEEMEEAVDDILTEGGWYKALNQVIDDIVTFPAGILKGPIVRKCPRLEWSQGPDGAFVPKVTETEVREFDRVSPFDFYPSPTNTTCHDGYVLEHHRLSPKQLSDMLGINGSGYNDENIREVLNRYKLGVSKDWLSLMDAERNVAEHKPQLHDHTMNASTVIDALEYWGSVSGTMLIDWGMDAAKVPDKDKQYDVCVWLIDGIVIKAMINADPLGRTPYDKASYEEVPGSFWGNSVFDLMADVQDVINAACRNLVNNMGFCSGPMIGVNIDRLAPGQRVSKLQPFQTFQLSDQNGGFGNNLSGQRLIEFYQPESRIQDFIFALEKFHQIADDVTGVPRYLGGSERVGGAGRTASGLSMLMQAASNTLKAVVSNIDDNIIVPRLESLYYHVMVYDPRPELKRSDVQIVARGASKLAIKETIQARRNEFLAATANPVDIQALGPEVRAALLEQAAKDLGFDLEDLRREAQSKAQQTGMGQQQPQQMPQQMPQQPAMPTQGQTLTDGSPVVNNFQ